MITKEQAVTWVVLCEPELSGDIYVYKDDSCYIFFSSEKHKRHTGVWITPKELQEYKQEIKNDKDHLDKLASFGPDRFKKTFENKFIDIGERMGKKMEMTYQEALDSLCDNFTKWIFHSDYILCGRSECGSTLWTSNREGAISPEVTREQFEAEMKRRAGESPETNKEVTAGSAYTLGATQQDMDRASLSRNACKDAMLAYDDCLHPYHALSVALMGAYEQAAFGKGKERHGGDLAFDEQPMQTISNMLNGPDGMAYQVMKKVQEATRMDKEKAIHELRGAIVYAAGMIVWLEDNR